jgi:hypothetical protein
MITESRENVSGRFEVPNDSGIGFLDRRIQI